MKRIKLKTRCRTYQCKNNHIARITGPSVEFDFEREILTRPNLGWEYSHMAIIDQPGLYEIQNCIGRGDPEKTYVVVDGKSKGEVSCQDALSLATNLNDADLKKIAKTALIHDRQKRRVNRLRKKELCLWVLDAAQQMGKLERREFRGDYVCIQVCLPIMVIPCNKPGFVGFSDPTLCGRKSSNSASKGSSDFQRLASKTLNKLTRSELETIAKPMIKTYDEKAMIQRVLAVVNHAQPEDVPNLQRAVELTENFNPRDCCYPITTEHYQRFLRLAANQGCLLRPNQLTQIL